MSSEAPRVVCHVLDTVRNLDTPYFRSIAQSHDRSAYQLRFLLIDAGELPDFADTPFAGSVATLGARTKFDYPMATLRLAHWLRSRWISLVHSHFFYPTLIGTTAGRLARKHVVFTRHHSDHNIRLGKKWHVRVDGLCARLADRVIAVSHATKRMMVEIEGVPPARIEVVHNGMHPLAPADPSDVSRVRTELALGPGPVLLMIARLHEEKGHAVLFDALPTLLARLGACNLLLAGEGVARRQLEAEVQARGLGGIVRFLGHRRDVAALISLADVAVLPSLAESFGYALVEAMSLGKPCVASDSGGIPEVVSDGETGFVVPMRDSAALAQAILRILGDPELARRMSDAGRRRASHFSFARMLAGYEAVYADVWNEN